MDLVHLKTSIVPIKGCSLDQQRVVGKRALLDFQLERELLLLEYLAQQFIHGLLLIIGQTVSSAVACQEIAESTVEVQAQTVQPFLHLCVLPDEFFDNTVLVDTSTEVLDIALYLEWRVHSENLVELLLR